MTRWFQMQPTGKLVHTTHSLTSSLYLKTVDTNSDLQTSELRYVHCVPRHVKVKQPWWWLIDCPQSVCYVYCVLRHVKVKQPWWWLTDCPQSLTVHNHVCLFIVYVYCLHRHVKVKQSWWWLIDRPQSTMFIVYVHFVHRHMKVKQSW